MKKLLSLIVLFGILILSGCSRGPVLYILNWNDYLDDELVSEFESLYDVRVVVDPSESNEAMYTRIHAQTTKYDIAVPSDYMIHKLYNENLLYELDLDKLPNYKSELFDPYLEQLRSQYFENNQKYAVPYFWGALGIMYNERKAGIKELVEQYEWEVFFNPQLTEGLKIAMYNSSRDAIAVAQMHLGIDINSRNLNDLKAAENILKAQNYFTWGTDDLKELIALGNCDIALVYTGDFFDMLYASLEDELEITYNMHVPDTNNIWFDALVIPKTSTNIDMAHHFINFIIEGNNAYKNAVTVGYCPTVTSAYEAMLVDPDYEDLIKNYPFYPGNIKNGTVYEDLGQQIYQQMEIILSNVKS